MCASATADFVAHPYMAGDAYVLFAADDLGAWLVGVLADAGRRKLTALVLGSDRDRALRQAAAEAVRLTAVAACPGTAADGRAALA